MVITTVTFGSPTETLRFFAIEFPITCFPPRHREGEVWGLSDLLAIFKNYQKNEKKTNALNISHIDFECESELWKKWRIIIVSALVST